MSGLSISACQNCGKEFSRAAKFCPACGAEQIGGQEQTAPQPAADSDHNYRRILGASGGDFGAADAMAPSAFADARASDSDTVQGIGTQLEALMAWLRARPTSTWIAAGAAGLAVTGAGIFFMRPAPSSPAAAPPVMIVQYITRGDAVVRNAPEPSAATAVATLARGQSVEGEWQTASDGTHAWFKIETGSYTGDYVWNKNLAQTSPPAVQKPIQADRFVVQDSDLYSAPDTGASIVQHLEHGVSAYVVAEVVGGWFEIALKRGGVGYLSASAFAAPDNPPAAAPVSAAEAADPGQIALAQVREYWAQWSSSDPAAMTNVENMYGGVVVFYGTSMGRDEVMRQKRVFAGRWPQRSYMVRDNSLQTNCDAAGSSCIVTGVLDWSAQSPARYASSVGAANFSFTLNIQDGQAKIVSRVRCDHFASAIVQGLTLSSLSSSEQAHRCSQNP